MRNVPIVHAEVPSPTDPRDYRRGALLGSVLVVLGILAWVLFAVMLIADPVGKDFRWLVLYGIIAGAAFVIPGILMIQRSKLGLWIMYLLSAMFVYDFCRGTIQALKHHTRDDIYGIYMSAALPVLWLSIAMYFHNRRALFTGWWRSEGTPRAQGDDSE